MEILLKMDGDQVSATWSDFVNLQCSPAGFGDTAKEAIIDLLNNTDDDVFIIE